MIFQGMRIFRMLSMLGGMLTLAVAAEFARPAEGPVPFRRDRVPLEAEAMGVLSGQIESLARALDAKTAGDRRGAAQMLALALALDPGNARARRLVDEYVKGRSREEVAPEALERARSRIWQIIAWLETPEAGEHGQALASCLKDVIAIADPAHPKSKALRETGEHGAWAGWVPEITAFRQPQITQGPDDRGDDPVDPPAVSDQQGIQLAEARVETVLWQNIGKEDAPSWALARVPLKMTARISEPAAESVGEDGEPVTERKRFSIRIGPGEADGRFSRTGRNIETLLESLHEKLPRGGRVQITSPEFESSMWSRRSQTVSAAAAVLADSAITGVEPDGIILGAIDETGAYKLSPGFWSQIKVLSGNSGQRVIVPADAAGLLPSMLAMEKPEFFMNNEVLVAADFKQLRDLSAKNPIGPLAEALAKFREIREKAGTQDLRLYVGNKFIRDRLATLSQEAPYHLSSRMLWVQAAGNRPSLVTRNVLAAELRQAIAPVSKIATNHEFIANPANLAQAGKLRDDCREKIDGLLKLADKADRELVEKAQNLTDLIRNLDRASKTRGEEYLVLAAVMSAQRALSQEFTTLDESLAEEAGEKSKRQNR
jgi:hypothetical protein